MSMVLTRNMCRQMTWELSTTCFFFFCVCVLPFFGFVSRWHETMWHVWSFMTMSCVHAPLHKGETKKNVVGFAACVKKTHEMSSQLSSGMLLGKWQWALSWTFEPNLTQLRAHVMYSGGLVSSPQGEQGSKPLYNYNFVYVFPDNLLFLFVYNLAWRPDRPLKPIEQENCQKGTPVEGTGGGRGRGGFSRPHLFLYSISRRHEVSPPTSSF